MRLAFRSPTVKRWMPFAYRDERTSAGARHLAPGFQGRVDHYLVAFHRSHVRFHRQRPCGGGRPSQRHVEVRGHRARWCVEPSSFHQVVGSGPVGVAIEQGSCDAPVEHPREGLVVRFGLPHADEFVARTTRGEAPDPKAFRVGWPATEADVVRSVTFLNARAVVHTVGW